MRKLQSGTRTGEGKQRNTKTNDKLPGVERGQKFDSGKPALSLIPGTSLRAIGEVMAYGRIKYDAHNWRKGIEHSRLLDAALRHLSYVCDGEFTDSESGLNHLAHAATNLIFLLDMMYRHPELNDLYNAPVHNFIEHPVVTKIDTINGTFTISKDKK